MVKQTAYRRVGDYDKTFGKSLDEIDGQEVFLIDFSVGARSLTTDGVQGEKPFTIIEVAKEPDGPVQTYHTWSESVAEKIGMIPKTDLPLQAVFKKIRTGGGFEVWDVS